MSHLLHVIAILQIIDLTFRDPHPCPDWYVRTEMVPSDEAAASISPSSWGAKATPLTEAVWQGEQ